MSDSKHDYRFTINKIKITINLSLPFIIGDFFLFTVNKSHCNFRIQTNKYLDVFFCTFT